MMKEKALPPLFPKTTVVVFVFVKRNEFDWTLEKGKNEMLENLILQFHGSLIYRKRCPLNDSKVKNSDKMRCFLIPTEVNFIIIHSKKFMPLTLVNRKI